MAFYNNTSAKQYSQLEQQLEYVEEKSQSEDGFRTLVEKTKAIIFIIQKEQICYVNPITEKITGYSQAELKENFYFCQQFKIKNNQFFRQNKWAYPDSQEIKFLTKDGKNLWLDCWFELIEFEGKPATMVTAIDITKYKQKESKICQALKREKELSKNKFQFLFMVSHELRTPLNVISFSTSVLKNHLDQWTEEKKLKYFYRLQSAVKQLERLIDEVLIIDPEAEKLKFNPQLLDLISLCQDILSEIYFSKSEQYKINFVVQGVRKLVHVDQKLLQHILSNLLANAVKYSSPENQIDFLLIYQNEKVIFKIKDQGIGILEEEQQKIFEPFYRGKNVGDVSGNGLGLAIVKKLVDLHSGQITVESQVGIGTTFTLVLD